MGLLIRCTSEDACSDHKSGSQICDALNAPQKGEIANMNVYKIQNDMRRNKQQYLVMLKNRLLSVRNAEIAHIKTGIGMEKKANTVADFLGFLIFFRTLIFQRMFDALSQTWHRIF